MILKIYVIFCLLVLILSELCIYNAIHNFKRKHKDIINKNKDEFEPDIICIMYTQLKLITFCFIPILNIGIMYAALSNKVEITGYGIGDKD